MFGGLGSFPAAGRSRHCVADDHRECGHVAAASRTRDGARLRSTVILCGCGCHDACSVTGWEHVPLTAWQELCECPGAAFQRTWKEDSENPWPGAREQRERRRREDQERKQAHDEAFQAAFRTARGKKRREVRELYLAELRARGGLDPAYEELFEAEVDALMHHPLRAFARLAHGMLKATPPEEEL